MSTTFQPDLENGAAEHPKVPIPVYPTDVVHKISIVDVSQEMSDPSPLGLFAFSIGTL